MGTYLDKTGLQKVWEKVKAHDTSTLTAAKNYTDGLQNKLTDGTVTVKVATNASNASAANKATNDANGNNIINTYATKDDLGNVETSCDEYAEQYVDGQKGKANGIATLDANGKVPSTQLPSYVDDVSEYASQSNFPATGEAGKIYVASDTNKTYRWSGTAYVEISASLALGETSSTAYAGSKGKANADNIATLQGYFTNGVAKSATKATQDGNGKNIADTYATKDDLGDLEDTMQTNAETYTDDCISTLESVYLPANYAAKTHTHNYAGSSSAGGAATSANKVNKSLIIKLNSGTTEGTNLFTFDGSTAKTINLTASLIGAATSGHNHDSAYAAKTHTHSEYALATDLPSALTEDDINEVCV